MQRRELLVGLATATFAGLVTRKALSQTSSLHAGSVEISDPEERALFDRLLCACGDCERLALSSCGCGWADDMRREVRDQRSGGIPDPQIVANYRERWGSRYISLPTDRGLDRAMWAVPIALTGGALFALYWLGRRWRQISPPMKTPDAPAESDVSYDARLDDELKRD